MHKCATSAGISGKLGLIGAGDFEKPPVHMMLVNQRNIVNPVPHGPVLQEPHNWEI